MRKISEKLKRVVPLFLLFVPLTLSAQGDITIFFKKGDTVSYNISEDGYLLFNKDTVKIKTSLSKQNDLFDVPLSSVRSLKFYNPLGTVSDLIISSESFSAFPNPVISNLYFTNVNVGEMVQIFSLGGIFLGEFAYSDEGLNLSRFPSGIYVISIKGESIKIRKQ